MGTKISALPTAVASDIIGTDDVFAVVVGGSTHQMSLSSLKSWMETAITSAWVTLTYGSTVATDATTGNNFELTATGNFTLSNPTGAVDGQILRWRIIQDSTGSRTITLGSSFNLGSDLLSITLSTTATKADYLTAVYRSSTGKFDVTGFLRGF